MLVTFTSKHSPDVVMFGHVAKVLLQGMGVSETPPGILRGDNLKLATEKLRTFLQTKSEEEALAQNAAEQIVGIDPNETIDEDDGEAQVHVGLAQRALPLLDMLNTACANEDDVTWR